MTPSKYQQDIFNTVITTPQNIAVAAGPGSGKSTTLIEVSKLIPYTKTAIFVAFANEIVKSLRNRLPQHTTCTTIHSLGARCIGGHLENGWFLSEKKQIDHIVPLFEKEKGPDGLELPKKLKWGRIFQIDRVMGMMRSTMTERTKEGIEQLITDYGLDLDDQDIPKVLRALRSFYEYNENEVGKLAIDFQDMVELPVLNNIPLPQYDYVFVDEVQDLSNLDRQFIQKLVKQPRGRIVAVGDKNQAIYGFRGAAIDSFEQFAAMKNTVTLPLSISYRCASEIVKEAQKVYQDIEVWEKAQSGKVRDGKIDDIQEGDMVLCRNTLPLIEVFFRLIDSDKKAYVVGKEFERGLLKILSKFDGSQKTAECGQELNNVLNNFVKQLREAGVSNPEKSPKYIKQAEKISILSLLFSKFTTIADVEEFIELVFEDEERDGVKLMTIHRSKGLECDRVFIIDTWENKRLIPSPHAVTPGQLKQEQNLKFVAITRAKKELVYLHL